MQTRQIVLDTETTGLEPSQGHRIIEIGGVELINRRFTGNRYHQYLQPDRDIDAGAVEVHGISKEFLADKPRFADIADEFLAFVQGTELIIHNAPFDVGFLDHELSLLGNAHGRIGDRCTILDTLQLARRLHPGQKNTLDALCKRYEVDNTQRTLHGALLDAEILADVYLAMTGGQVALSLDMNTFHVEMGTERLNRIDADRAPLRVIRATEEDRAAHGRYLDLLDRSSGGNCLWRGLDAG